MVMKKNLQGFTLIELMIVIAVLAVLAAIAYPSYQNYVQRTKRADVQAEMMQIAQRLQGHHVIHHNFSSATLDNGGIAKTYPATQPVYTITLRRATQVWTLTAAPRGGC